MGTEALQHKLEVLQQHCRDLGRDYSTIEKTALATAHLAPGQNTPASVIQQCRDLAALGFSHAIFSMPNVYEIKPLEIFGKEIIPAVREI